MPTHTEQRLLPYAPELVFDMVADVGRYPEFLPWCVATRIHRRTEDRLMADVIVGFKMIREKFTSDVRLDRPGLVIAVRYLDGPFRHLENHWRFETADVGGEPDGCLVDFYIDFEFRSAVLRKLMGALFEEAVSRMVGAFERRATDLYGGS